LSDLKPEPNSTTLYGPRIGSNPWASPEIYPGGQRRRIFAYPVQIADDAMQMNIQKALYPFSPISLCWLKLNSQPFV